MAADVHASTGRPAAADDFGDVLVGIDETPESLVAAAQAGVLRAPGGRLVLLAVAERYLAAHAGLAGADAGRQLSAGTSADLSRARALVDADEAVLTSGRLVHVLRAECARRGSSLMAVGARPHRRLTALIFGGHDVEALHDAHCSVLIARPGWGPHPPERVVVAVDGSAEARTAQVVARRLAARLGSTFLPVVGLEDTLDPDVLRSEGTDVLLDPRSLVDAVASQATASSLVVVGRGRERSRRVERIAYRARCSVLVVRHESDGPV